MEDIQKKGLNAVIDGFRKNDDTVLKRVYQSVFPKVKAYILKNSGNEAQAKDIFQEAFIACWRNIKADKLSEDGNVEAYLFTIAKNKWTDYLRSSNRKKMVLNNDITNIAKADDDPEINEDLQEKHRNTMNLALQQLGHNCKNLLNKFYFERKSMNEIAEEMNLASASARNQKYRCMEKLRKLSLELQNNGQ